MEDKTKAQLKVGAAALLYYWAARDAHKPFKGPLEGFLGAKTEAVLKGPVKLLWGLVANNALQELGLSPESAFNWTLAGALGLEWYIVNYKTKFALLQQPPPAVGWDFPFTDPYGDYALQQQAAWDSSLEYDPRLFFDDRTGASMVERGGRGGPIGGPSYHQNIPGYHLGSGWGFWGHGF